MNQRILIDRNKVFGCDAMRCVLLDAINVNVNVNMYW
jgi:hypothetical protein